MDTLNPTQSDAVKRTIEDLEAQRECVVTRITNSYGSPRVNHVYLVAIDDELRRCRRALTQIKNDAA